MSYPVEVTPPLRGTSASSRPQAGEPPGNRSTIDWETQQVARSAQAVADWHWAHPVLILRTGLMKPPGALQAAGTTVRRHRAVLERQPAASGASRKPSAIAAAPMTAARCGSGSSGTSGCGRAATLAQGLKKRRPALRRGLTHQRRKSHDQT